MTASSQSLFHYTGTVAVVKLILENGLRFNRLEEELPLHGYASNIFDQLPGFVKHIQFRDGICLCDIPPHAAESHRTEYGRYALGFSKEWAMGIGASPVRYVHRMSPDVGSEFFNTILDLPAEIRRCGSIYDMMAEMMNAEAPQIATLPDSQQLVLKKVDELCRQLLAFCDFSASYLRLHDGDWEDRASGNITHRIFYEENEWRIVRSPGHADFVRFTVREIVCILVETDQERDEIINHAMTNCHMLEIADREMLSRKVKTYTEVLGDANRQS